MKVKMFLIGLIQISLIQNAFNQNSVVDTTKLWSNIDLIEVPFGGTPYCNLIKFSEDTLIDYINYKKVWKSVNQKDWIVIGYIRENSNDSVFFMNKNKEEGLIYNFNVQIGDTIMINNTNFNQSYSVNTIVADIYDTIINQTNRKILILKDTLGNSKEKWIEGIGSLNGIIETGYCFYQIVGSEPNLLSYKEKGIEVFKNNSVGEYCFCEICNNIQLNQFKNQIAYYYNNLEKNIIIKIDNISELKIFPIITIYNLIGEKVLSEVINSKKTGINISYFKDGIYFIVVDYRNLQLANTFIKY